MMTSMMMLILSTIMYMISHMKLKMNLNKEKMNSFECGFNPFLSPQSSFSIQFFKILMIFLLFDMEIIIIMPSPLFSSIFFNSAISMMMILIILILGLLFEWKEGSLQWLK